MNSWENFLTGAETIGHHTFLKFRRVLLGFKDFSLQEQNRLEFSHNHLSARCWMWANTLVINQHLCAFNNLSWRSEVMV